MPSIATCPASPIRRVRPRILVAEDETLIRLDLCALLEERGWEVCGQARDGRDAVRQAAELEPDVALVDVRMPVVDGIEATRLMQEARPTPIVVMTAYDRPSVLARSLLAGATALLLKPLEENEIVTRVAAAPGCLPPDRHTNPTDGRRTLRRAEIVATAKRLFAAKGYDATSTGDIASEVGLLKGSLYHHIASKEEVLVTIVHEFLAASTAILRHAAATSGGPRRRLEVFATARRALHALDRDGSTILSRCPASISELPLRSIGKAARADRGYVTDLLVEGVVDGSLQPPGEPANMAESILGLVATPLPHVTRGLGDDAIDAVARSCAAFVLAAVARPEARGRARATLPLGAARAETAG